MSTSADPKEILSTLLRTLGFEHEIREATSPTGSTLQVFSPDEELLIGPEGETLEDLQFLVNRLLQIKDPASPKVHLDVGNFRQERNDRLIAQVKAYAALVRESGTPYHLEPMNAYDRRLIHHFFKSDPEITTSSPQDDARIKRITLLLRSEK